MKRSVLLFTFIIAPLQALAAGFPAQLSSFMAKIYIEILNPLISLAFAVAILYLSWSVIQYTLLKKDKIDQAKLKDSLIYGVVGVAIMSLVFGLMKFIARTITGDDSVITDNV